MRRSDSDAVQQPPQRFQRMKTVVFLFCSALRVWNRLWDEGGVVEGGLLVVGVMFHVITQYGGGEVGIVSFQRT